MTTKQELQRLCSVIAVKLAKLEADLGEAPDWRNHEARGAYDRRERLAMQDLLKELQREEGATYGLSGAHDHHIRLAGIRSSSTSGWDGCLSNWKAAARKRMAKEA